MGCGDGIENGGRRIYEDDRSMNECVQSEGYLNLGPLTHIHTTRKSFGEAQSYCI